MIKNSIKTIAILAVTALMLTGCAENRENNFNGNESNSSIIENSSASANSEAKEPDISTTTNSTTTSQTPNYPKPNESFSTATSTVEKPVEKPIDKPASTTSSTTTSTASKPIEKPVATSSTTTTTTASKPIEKPIEKPVHTHNFTNATCEKPAACSCGITKGNALGHNYTSATCNKLATCTICGATKGTFANHNYKNGTCAICGKNDPNYAAPHNCDKDGHVWEITYTTTEPKWCREMHDVDDYGFDATLAAKYLGVSAGEATQILWNNLEAMGVSSAIGSATIDVEVWGTETYERKICKVCGDGMGSNHATITPMGEWRYINGQNPRCKDPRLNFNTLFYDPNNIPQVVIDNINLMDELLWA